MIKQLLVYVMDESRRAFFKSSGALLGVLMVPAALTGCVAPRAARRRGQVGVIRRPLRWARPNVLLVPRGMLLVGSTLVLPNGNAGQITRIQGGKVSVSIDGSLNVYPYELE